jgi:membrane associated rhomboid family serine protease
MDDIGKGPRIWLGYARSPFLGPFLASIGRRDDFRRTDDWNDPPHWENRGWRGRIPASLPINYSLAILAICVVVSLLSLIAPGFVYGYLALTPAYLFQRPWTLITHMFVHQNFDHLFWNMFFLFFFALPLEQRVGEKRFLEIYIFSGLVGAIAQMLISSPYAIMMGASGALYGAMGCLAMIAPEIRVLLFFVIPLRIQWAVVLYVLIDFSMLGAADNIAHMAHITGLLVGVAFGYMMRDQPRIYHSF